MGSTIRMDHTDEDVDEVDVVDVVDDVDEVVLVLYASSLLAQGPEQQTDWQ